jgi:CheY-like chemotaxis protein
VSTEGIALTADRSVLVIDRSEETREVLRTALERRGVRIYAAGGKQRGLELAREHHPDVIVLDLDLENSPPEDICAPFVDQPQSAETPMVFLGSRRGQSERLPQGEFVSKPYHYGPLIRRIEELLGATGQALARSA